MKKDENKNKLIIRNATIDFLLFSAGDNSENIQVIHAFETIWLSQKLLAKLFDVDIRTISEHLINIYEQQELSKESTVRNFRIVQNEGNREVKRDIEHFNLDSVISVGYRVNSRKATQFRQWATNVLREFAVKGYVLDRKRMENGSFLGEDYFERLLEEIREIRLSERRFYQKVTDIYATSIDYDKNAPTTKEFFAKVQNKLHYAVHGQTAAELIYGRSDADRDNMGLTSWEKSPDGKILKHDVIIAKNYLTKDEIESLGRIVNAYLELAEDRAKKKNPMTMEDWAKRLDAFLKADERDILGNAGAISAQEAIIKAENEFKKYRPVQDKLFESDFDREITKLLEKKE